MSDVESEKLTAKEKAWADAYLITLNKAEAARRAKYKGDNKTLAHVGWENYRKEHIQAYMKDKLDKMAMSSNEVLARLAAIAHASMEDYIEILPGGRTILMDFEGAKEAGVLGQIRKLKITKEGPEIELYDAQAALLNIGKQHGLFSDRHIVDVRLEKEVEQILNVLEEVLSPDDYQRILARLGSGSTGSAETTEPDNSELAG